MKIKDLVCFLVFLLVIVSNVWARVSGLCSNCHTMHNFQNGSVVTGSGPNPALTKVDCVGCHSSEDSSTTYQLGSSVVPVVLYRGGSAPTQYLAGGNFWWVKEGLGGDDTKGHNVFLNEDDDNLTVAPGYNISSCGTDSCHNNLSRPASGASDPDLDLEGRYGCRGCHLRPKHHADDSDTIIDSADEGWFRFLSGHMSGQGHGVVGIEDPDWQATVSPSDHNEYLGSTSGSYTEYGGFGALGNTMTAFCTGCHGRFHVQNGQVTGGSPWLRHPSDAVIPNSGEYASYTEYNPLAPVARPNLTGYNGPSSIVTPGTDLVMCLSCHRAHGSPYPDMLRWDYLNACKVGVANDECGCFICHSAKD